jgi:hypothetical protein
MNMSDDKLKPAALHVELKDKIEQLAKVGAGGIGEALDNIYEQTLPLDLPIETVQRVRAHDKAFIAASADAWGDLSRAAAVEDGTLQSTTARFPMTGGSYVDFTWDRAVERNAGIAAKGEVAPKKTVYGAMSGKAVMGGSDSGAGELNKVFKRQKQAAYDLFAPATETA